MYAADGMSRCPIHSARICAWYINRVSAVAQTTLLCSAFVIANWGNEWKSSIMFGQILRACNHRTASYVGCQSLLILSDVTDFRCESAPNIKTARLLAAKEAIQNWANAPAPKPGSVTALQNEQKSAA